MSDNVMSHGIMAPLNRTLTIIEQEDFLDKYPTIKINYEGTIVYTDNKKDIYGISFGQMSEHDLSTFDILQEEDDLHMVANQARSYSCLWYNGADSDMDTLTLEDFLKQTEQTT